MSAFTRHVERIGRLGAVKAEDAELISAYCEGCAPQESGR